MTDPTQSARAHPSPDELADLRADVLSETRGAEVSSHVESCAQCADELAAMDEVEILLAEAGRQPAAMPADVAQRLDDALAQVSRERATGVASLDEKRASKSSSSRLGAWLPRLGVAAAVVIIAGVFVDIGTNSDNDISADDAGDAGGSQTLEEGSTNSDTPGDLNNGGKAGGGVKPQIAPQRVTKDNLPEYAQELSGVPVAAASRMFRDGQALDAASMCPPSRVTEKARRVPVRFAGTSAFVVVKPEAREVSVYACDSTRQELYSTSY